MASGQSTSWVSVSWGDYVEVVHFITFSVDFELCVGDPCASE